VSVLFLSDLCTTIGRFVCLYLLYYYPSIKNLIDDPIINTYILCKYITRNNSMSSTLGGARISATYRPLFPLYGIEMLSLLSRKVVFSYIVKEYHFSRTTDESTYLQKHSLEKREHQRRNLSVFSPDRVFVIYVNASCHSRSVQNKNSNFLPARQDS
jgi:hypothetical protein